MNQKTQCLCPHKAKNALRLMGILSLLMVGRPPKSFQILCIAIIRSERPRSNGGFELKA